MQSRFEESYLEILKSGDKRANVLPLVDSPIYVLCAVTLYILMVIVGPKLMKNREAFQIRRLLIVYNFLSVVLSLYMFLEFFRTSVLNPEFFNKTIVINEKDTSYLTMALIKVHWLYYISKYLEFFDTFFFILRKKNVQISFLHVYHHGSMLVMCWGMIKYVPGGGSYFGPMLNCFVHTVMYAYYMLSAFGPHMQKYLWWKKYITRLQMLQFVAIVSECAGSVIFDTNRSKPPYAKEFYLLNVGYISTLFILFNHFYQKAYKQKEVKKVD